MHDLQVMCPLSPSIAHMSPCIAGLIGPSDGSKAPGAAAGWRLLRNPTLAGQCLYETH